MARREIHVDVDSALKKRLGVFVLMRLLFHEMPQATMEGFPCVQAFRRLAQCALPFSCSKNRCNRLDYARGDVFLNSEDVCEVAVVPLRPQMSAAGCLNKLSCNPNAIACSTNASFQHVANAKLAPDLLDVDALCPCR